MHTRLERVDIAQQLARSSKVLCRCSISVHKARRFATGRAIGNILQSDAPTIGDDFKGAKDGVLRIRRGGAREERVGQCQRTTLLCFFVQRTHTMSMTSICKVSVQNSSCLRAVICLSTLVSLSSMAQYRMHVPAYFCLSVLRISSLFSLSYSFLYFFFSVFFFSRLISFHFCFARSLLSVASWLHLMVRSYLDCFAKKSFLYTLRSLHGAWIAS